MPQPCATENLCKLCFKISTRNIMKLGFTEHISHCIHVEQAKNKKVYLFMDQNYGISLNLTLNMPSPLQISKEDSIMICKTRYIFCILCFPSYLALSFIFVIVFHGPLKSSLFYTQFRKFVTTTNYRRH